MQVVVVNVKKEFLIKNGFNNFNDWATNSKHLYIGRNMNYYVKGANGSKWQNPYSSSVHGLDKCLELYEEYVRKGDLYKQLEELDGKILGCWCHPNKCHGDVLIKLLQEKKNKTI